MGGSRLIDVSPAIDARLAVWPGDTPPAREVLLDMARGDNLTLSTLRATVHLGAHVDAPSHYGRDAPAVEAWDLERFVGACRVVDVRASVASAAEPGDGPGERRVPAAALDGVPLDAARILLATGTYPDPARFDTAFAGLSVELVERLAGAGVRLVGLDTPSVDAFASKELPAHRACLEGDVAILEGLRLDGVAPGRYELIALPLRLVGFDASPVRAVLRGPLPEEG